MTNKQIDVSSVFNPQVTIYLKIKNNLAAIDKVSFKTSFIYKHSLNANTPPDIQKLPQRKIGLTNNELFKEWWWDCFSSDGRMFVFRSIAIYIDQMLNVKLLKQCTICVRSKEEQEKKKKFWTEEKINNRIRYASHCEIIRE